MLKKLLKYDFLSILRFLIPLLLFTPVLAGLAGLLYWLASLTGPKQILLALGLMSMSGFAILVLVLSAAVLPIMLIIRYYSGLYSDTGYLTLMLPVKRWKLIFSKMICAFLCELAHITVLFFSAVFVFGAFVNASNPFRGYVMVFVGIKDFLAALSGQTALLLVEIILYVLVWIVLQFSILYLGVTLGAVIFQGKGKVWGSVLFCFVTNSAVQTVFSLVELAISGGIIGILSVEALENGFPTQFFLLIEILMRIGISIGLYFFNVRLAEKKLNLG